MKLSLLLTYIYVDVVASNLNGIALHTHRRISGQLPGSHVVFPTVPRTYDYLTFQLTFAQRPASMQAYVIDCKQFTFHVGQRDVLPVYIELADRSRRYFVLLSCPQESHRAILSKFVGTRRVSGGRAPSDTPFCVFYRGAGDWATITPSLNPSTISGFNRTAVGCFANDIWSILSCNFSSA